VPDSQLKPITTLNEYRRAVEQLRQRVAGDHHAAALVGNIERVVRFELEHRFPEEDRFFARFPTPIRRASARTALISDIHGSHDGLLAALNDIEAQNCESIVCLGDLVDGGAGNEQVIETLRKRGIPCVRGNHDEINDLALSEVAHRFLKDLPLQLVEEDVLYVHISPRPISRKIDHAVEAWNVFEESDYRLIFVGHVHIPHIFGKRSTIYGEAARHAFEYNRPFDLSVEERYIVSVGSVGYGRDLVGRIRYAIFDRKANTVELRAVDGPLLSLDYALR
jgi:predicted phosphodiesterase